MPAAQRALSQTKGGIITTEKESTMFQVAQRHFERARFHDL